MTVGELIQELTRFRPSDEVSIETPRGFLDIDVVYDSVSLSGVVIKSKDE
jgi:hypothetical protein